MVLKTKKEDMNSNYKEDIQKLLEVEELSPFKKGVFESYLRKKESEPQFNKEVLLDIIRSLTIVLGQEVILKMPLQHSLEAYIEVYNILFGKDKLGIEEKSRFKLYEGHIGLSFELIKYKAILFTIDSLDPGESLMYNETIAKGSDGLYYLCNKMVEPIDTGFETLEKLYKVHMNSELNEKG